ncbi:hypothetical protein ACWD4V_16365 [Streptomyces tsukubensis]|uniref:hypothetical protein n=1 Tax=Streptomyces tsukubensis TaxID=83656 RepID=UPI0036B3673A
MPNTTDTVPETGERGTPQSRSEGLVRARRSIHAARDRDMMESDGGGTGRSDGND